MAHELAGALQPAGRIRQRCAVKEPHVYVRSEYIDVAEGRISQTCNRAAVMQKLPNFVPALSHHLKPLMRDGSQFTCMLFHPRIDGGIPLNSAVESEQFGSSASTSRHDRIFFCHCSVPTGARHIKLIAPQNAHGTSDPAADGLHCIKVAMPTFEDRSRPASINGPGTELDKQQVVRSEEHTSELQSPYDLVCRLLL